VADLLVVSLTVAAHQLQDPTNGYEVVSYGRGGAQLRRNTVESFDVPGRLLVSWVEDVMLGAVVVRVKAANDNTLKTRTDTLIGWFRGVDYTLTATLSMPASSGSTWVESWKCEPADYEVGNGGVMDPELLGNAMQEIAFTFPHNPVAL
jgi:hypothetical protein